MRIEHITCYEVMVPAKPGTVDSESINKPLHQLPPNYLAGMDRKLIWVLFWELKWTKSVA